MQGERGITEFDYAILSYLIFAPACGYAVRKAFEKALSSHWSAGTGSVYPALRRLAALGVITAEGPPTSKTKGKVLYRVTDIGVEAIRRWLATTPNKSEISAFFDPMRLRMQLLHTLPRVDQVERIREWIDAATAYVRVVDTAKADIEGAPRPVHYRLAVEYVLRTAELRVEWLRDALRTLEGDMIGTTGEQT